MSKTLLKVGNILLARQAILLPSINKYFRDCVTDILAAKGCLEPTNLQAVTSRLILSDLTANLKHHITYSCKVRKYGTLVYRPGTDLAPLLSEAMWRLQNTTPTPDSSEGKGTCSDSDLESMDTVVNRCFDHLSQVVNRQIYTFLAKAAGTPFEYDDIDLEEVINHVDPQLWKAVCLFTRSTSELRGTSKVNEPSSPAYRKKRVRRLFLLCMILFCADDRCSMPMHTLLTDTIDSQGGSASLIKILNRLGVCAYADTLSRFIQFKASTFQKNKVRDLLPDTFTVVSADNIDFLHSYAKVFGGQQTGSWHGTTVQAIQPLPSLAVHENPLVLGLPPHPIATSAESGCLSVDPPVNRMPEVTHSLVGAHEGPFPVEGMPEDPPSRPQSDHRQASWLQRPPSPPSVDISLANTGMGPPTLEGMPGVNLSLVEAHEGPFPVEGMLEDPPFPSHCEPPSG